MKLNKPKFWDDKKISILAIILLPLTIFVIINNLILSIIPKKN